MRKRIAFLIVLFFIDTPIAAAVLQNDIVPTVVVHAPKKSPYTLTSGDQSIITHEQMTATGTTSLAQALQTLGGIQLQDLSGTGTQVLLNLRGFGANANSNTLLLVNGIPLTNPDLAPPDISIIPLHNIEYIEITAGSESVLYGDQAVGGVINIITRAQAREKAAFSCSAGSYNQRNCYAAFYTHDKAWRLATTLSAAHTDNYRDHNMYDQQYLSGQGNYRYARGQINIDYNLANEIMQYPGALTAAQVRQNRRQATNDIDYFKNWNGYFHLQQEQQLSADWRLTTDFAARRMQGRGVLFSSFTQSRSTYFIKPTLKGKVHQADILAGLDGEIDGYHLGSAFGITNTNQQKYGVFGLMNLPLYTHLSLSAGARAAEQSVRLQTTATNDNLNRAVATTIGLTYQLRPDLDFYLRRAGSFRFPKADEDAETPSGVNGLRTQRGIAYESGLSLHRANYSAKINLYQLNLRDEITFDPLQTPQQPFGANTNLSPTTRTGFSISGSDRLFDRLTLNGQYNYVNARFQNGINSGNRIPLVAESVIRAGADWSLQEHWNIYVEGLFTGSQFAANDYANVAGQVGGYTTYNFNIRMHYPSFNASLHVNNIFNKYYYIYTAFQSGTDYFYPAAGRNVVLTVDYLFM